MVNNTQLNCDGFMWLWFIIFILLFDSEMEEQSLLLYVDESRNYFGEIGCEQLLGFLNYNEYVDIEDRKTCLFSKRVDYSIMV